MSWRAELRALYYMTMRRQRGATHAARMESFYAAQASHYDRFREGMLHGRRELYEAIPVPAGGTWIDFGAGTGRCLEFLGPRLGRAREVFLVDVAPSMLAVARQRVAESHWSNVQVVEADVLGFQPPGGRADVVTFAYSLSMVPDWPAALEQARRILKPHGRIGVVDFYVSRRHPPPGRARHTWPTRAFWPAWFGRNDVHVSPDLLPALDDRFACQYLVEARGRLPYMPAARVPWFAFVGANR